MRTSEEGLHTSFLPDFCGTRIVFVVVLLAELLALIFTLAHFPALSEFFYELALYSLFIQWMALSCILALCLSRPYLYQLGEKLTALISYLITILVSLLITEFTWWILNQAGLTVFGSNNHTMFLFRSMGISAIVSALALRYFYVQHQWRLKTQSESEARFQALQSRIRPHFFFNCMNIITSLIRTNPGKAEGAVEDLADLFRASLQDVKKHSTLEDELELCKGYLRIEQHRLGNRLDIAWNIEDLDFERDIPPLSLQPLVENAVYHGIELIPEGGRITISGHMDGSTIEISIRNPLTGKHDLRSRSKGHKLAQLNIKQRLESIYHQTGLLVINEDDMAYEVIIRIPQSNEDIDR